jgi:hypothetical protein
VFFICYTWVTNMKDIVIENKFLESEHPLRWLADKQADEPKAHCRLISWQRLTEEEAAMVKSVSWPADFA